MKLDELVASGDLTPGWLPSFQAVPRQQFIPDTVWVPEMDYLKPVYRAMNPDHWLALASGDESVITQVDDGHPVGPGDAGNVPTSSASMPLMVTQMLKHLDVHGGERVLEIGTGTGWNAALLAHRLGADRVTTVEIDHAIALRARKALSDAGFGDVVTVVNNGTKGHPEMAPYHRVISTAACHTVPYAWVEQTCPGGRIVTPWGGEWLNFGLLTLTVHNNGTAAGFLVGTSNFMRLRDQRFVRRPVRPTDEEEEQAGVSETELHPADVLNTDHAMGAIIALTVSMKNCRTSYTEPENDPDGDGVLWVIDHSTDSWARLEHRPGEPGPYKVRQFGPRRLWDEVEEAHQWWVDKGKPGADRWLFTVTPLGQQIELV